MTAQQTGAARPTMVGRLDPRVKIVAALLITISLVTVPSVVGKGTICALLLLTWFVGRVPLRLLGVTLVSLLMFFVSTMALHAVVRGARAADAVAVLGVPWSASGAVSGAEMCAQILGIVLSLVLLVSTTVPVELGEGIELLLSPLRRWGTAAHDGALMFTIALRFLPLMRTEFSRLQLAQVSRGGGVHRRRWDRRARALIPLLLPLFIVTVIRAKDLSEAMEARGYRGPEGRSRVRELRLTMSDLAVLVGCVLLLAAAIAFALAGAAR